jgi:hypothetical protein
VRRGGIVTGRQEVQTLDGVRVGPGVDRVGTCYVERPVDDAPDSLPPELGVPLEQLARLAFSGRQW